MAARKTKTPEGITQIQPQIYAESEAGAIAQRLVNAGLPMEKFDEFIFSEADVVRLLNQIEALEKKNLTDSIRSGIRTIEPGKVFDMEGKQIPRGSDIMGGKAVPGTSDRERVRNEMKTKYGFTDERLDEIENTPVDEKMADDLLREDDERIIKERIEKQNKDSVQKILDRKNREDVYGLEDYDTTNMSDIQKEIIRTETKLGNLNPNTPGFRDRAKPLIDKIEALKNKMRDDKADGGRIGLLAGSVPKVLKLLKNKKRVQQAVDDIFPTGDYKYDAQMAADALVENNPKTFGGKLYEDLDMDTQMEVYGAVLQPITNNMAKQMQLKRATRPEKTLAAMKEGRGIDMSDPGISDEFTRFMKETDPEGYKKLEQTVELSNFKTKDRKKNATGGRIGFFMGSKPVKGLATLRQMLNYFGKKSDRVKNPSDILKIVNPKRLNQMLEDPNIYRKFDVEKGIAAPDLIKNMQKQMMGDRQKTIEEMLGSAKNIKRADDNTIKYKNEMIEDMMKKGVDREMAEEMAGTISKMAENAAGKMDTPKLTDEGILQLENILKDMETGGKTARELNATGGRIGYKDGPGMNRRTFLKLLGGLASIPIIGKIVKPLKTVKGVKNVPIIKTDNLPGKPEWFDQLVNKVIIEGDDVTKKLATQERQIVHSKDLGDGTTVRVTQDMDEGAIRVEYESPENMYGDPVQLQYKKSLPDEGNPRPSAEFDTAESVPVARADDPDDFNIEIDEGGGSSISDLSSDVSKLKEYATGKKPTLKEIVQTKKRKDQTKAISEGDRDAEFEFMEKRQGQPFYDPPEPDDFASGGIARMLGE